MPRASNTAACSPTARNRPTTAPPGHSSASRKSATACSAATATPRRAACSSPSSCTRPVTPCTITSKWNARTCSRTSTSLPQIVKSVLNHHFATFNPLNVAFSLPSFRFLLTPFTPYKLLHLFRKYKSIFDLGEILLRLYGRSHRIL